MHDDARFAAEPSHFDRVIQLLKPAGLLTMPNWLLQMDALAGKHHHRWGPFAGPAWEETMQAYARRLATDRRIHVT